MRWLVEHVAEHFLWKFTGDVPAGRLKNLEQVTGEANDRTLEATAELGLGEEPSRLVQSELATSVIPPFPNCG
jgi:hypothetical protein